MRLIRVPFLALSFLLAFLASSSNAQQPFLSRYDLYGGFANLNTPDLGLNQVGFNAQAGVNPRPWFAIGMDYSIATGSELLTTALLPANLQAQVNGAQAGYTALGLLPPGYRLAVSTDATTQTFAVGPQLAFRRLARLSLFARPDLGALREHAVPHPADAFSTVIVKGLAPAGYKQDWTPFYGAGGGGDLILTRRVGLRLQFDAVHDHPFNDILANGRWTFRFSVGPSVHLGRNILTAASRTP